MSRPRRDRFFAGKTAFVTGGTRGLGLVLARELAWRGASVAVVNAFLPKPTGEPGRCPRAHESESAVASSVLTVL